MAPSPRTIVESPSYGNPAGFQNIVIPAIAETDGAVISLILPTGIQWWGELTQQQVFGAIATVAPTGVIFIDVNDLGPLPAYQGGVPANGVIAAGDYFQAVYDVLLGTDGGFHILNWDNAGSGQSITLTTNGTQGVATLVGGVLNIPDYSSSGNTHIVTDSNPVVVLADDGTIIFNQPAPNVTTAVSLPDVALRNGLPLVLSDFGGNAGDIVLTPSGAETIMGLPSATLGSGGQGVGTAASITLVPSVALSGWYVA